MDVPDLSGLVKLEGALNTVHASGGFGDVRKGVLEGVGPVALKLLVLRGHDQPALRVTKVCISFICLTSWGNSDNHSVMASRRDSRGKRPSGMA